MSVLNNLINKLGAKQRTVVREFISEFMGTFTLLTIGNSVIAAYLFKFESPNLFSVCFAYGVGAMIATLGCGHISGAHINPAGTFALAVFGKHPWWKVPYYLAAQYLAGFVSSFIIYLVYYDAFSFIDGLPEENRLIGGSKLYAETVFTTYPWTHATVRGVLVDQIIGTAMLFFSLNCIGNTKGFSLPNAVQAPVICLLITGCCLAFGLNAGAIFNPARDFAPRLFAYLIFGGRVFEPLNGHYWWAAGIVGPHLGAILGVFLFRLACDHYSETAEKDRTKECTFRIDDPSKRANESTTSIC